MVIEPVLTIFRSVADGAGLLVVDSLLQASGTSSAARAVIKRISLSEYFITASIFRGLLSILHQDLQLLVIVNSFQAKFGCIYYHYCRLRRYWAGYSC